MAERGAERLDGKEPALPFRAAHPQAVRAQRQAGHDDVQVRVVLHLARPGVQHGGEAGRAAQVLFILREIHEGQSHGPEHRVVEPALCAIGEGPQFTRQGEGEQPEFTPKRSRGALNRNLNPSGPGEEGRITIKIKITIKSPANLARQMLGPLCVGWLG